jgi:hypothetical protein
LTGARQKKNRAALLREPGEGPMTMTAIEHSGGNANSDLTEAQLIRAIKAHIERGDKAKDKAEQHYISAGQYLAKLKEHSPDQATFLTIVKEKIGLGKSRTYELLQIADRTKTVGEIRVDTAKRVMKHKSCPLANGQDEPDDPTVVARDRAEVTRLWDNVVSAEKEATGAVVDILAKLRAAETKIIGLESEVEELKTENAELLKRLAESENENFALCGQLEKLKPPDRCPWVKDDGGRKAAGYREASGDCVARAITIATGKPYAEVYEALKARHARYVKRLRPGSAAHGVEERRRTKPVDNGCGEKIYGPYLRSLGWQYTRLRARVYLRAGALPSGRLIVLVNHHLVAVIDGAIHDTYDSGGHGKRPVASYWSHGGSL